MPLFLLGLSPLVAGLFGLFKHEITKTSATTPAAGGTPASIKPMPWYVLPMIIIGVIILVIMVTKGILKKQNIL
jgi:hypothetical protein